METADVVVVGGGVMGCSIALHLARRRAGRVVVCEKRFVASGPTGRSSALLRRHYSLELYARMAARAFETYSHFEDLTGRPADITRCGLVMAVGPDDLAAMRDTLAMLQRIGVKAEALGPDDLERLVPGIDATGLAGAVYEPDTGYADPAGVTHAYAARARELGVEIRETTEVTALVLGPDGLTAVGTTGGPIATGAVVLAAGPWSARLARPAGIDLPVIPSRQQLAIFRPPTGFPARRPILVDLVERTYYRPETGGLLLLGSRNPAGVAHETDPDAFNERIDADRLAWSSEVACRRFPALASGEAVGGYASVYDLTPDLHFIIEASPQLRGLFLALGFSGHGFKHSPVIGEAVAELVTEGRSPSLDLSAFASSRFAGGAPLRGRYKGWPY